jgi:hypothetical protein
LLWTVLGILYVGEYLWAITCRDKFDIRLPEFVGTSEEEELGSENQE